MNCPHCKTPIPEHEILKAAAKIYRARQGPAAAETRRAQMTAINAARTLAPCTCGRTESPHTAVCPVGRRERWARKRAKSETTTEKESKP